jgi:magnesium chelatase family protein
MPRVLTAVLRGVYAQLVEVEDAAPETAQGLAAAVARRVRADVTGVVLYAAVDAAGRLLPVRGAVCVAVAAQKRSLRVIVPSVNGPEAAGVAGADVRQAETLDDVLRFLRGTGELARPEPDPPADTLDRLEVPGDEHARRAVELAAAGAHTLLVVGPKGPEAMRVARSLASALPPLCALEAHEATVIASVTGLLGPGRSAIHRPPLRTPHHTVTREGLLGGDRPGEVSLAHAGVLALEDLPEYPKGLLRPLWDTLASGAAQTVDGAVPARFILAATMPPCPCGWAGHQRLRCTCSPQSVERHWQRMDTSLFDVCVTAAGEKRPGVHARSPGAPAEPVQERVARARAIQLERGELNGRVPLEHVTRSWGTDAAAEAVLRSIPAKPREIVRVLRLARTAADLEGDGTVGADHVRKALDYRVDRAGP